MSKSVKSEHWLLISIVVGVLALLVAPVILWKYLPQHRQNGSETYSNVRFMKEVKGKVGTELYLEFTGSRVTATLTDFDGGPDPVRTFLKGESEGRKLEIKGSGPRGNVEITGRAEGAVFSGHIIRWMGSDKVEHPLLLKRSVGPGEENSDLD
jgi:hypothetical protein